MALPLHIVCYDIRCPKRWRRVFRLMEQTGTHRQLSVFLVRADRRTVNELAAQLSEIIDPEEDSVLIAPLRSQAGTALVELGIAGPLPGAQLLIL